jgi:hypothetical protein
MSRLRRQCSIDAVMGGNPDGKSRISGTVCIKGTGCPALLRSDCRIP